MHSKIQHDIACSASRWNSPAGVGVEGVHVSPAAAQVLVVPYEEGDSVNQQPPCSRFAAEALAQQASVQVTTLLIWTPSFSLLTPHLAVQLRSLSLT